LIARGTPRQRHRGRLAALPREFYDRPTELVARELLGAILECRTPQGVASGRIVETEAYIGEHDLACHATAGRTARTEPLYGAPGMAYVYFIYGMYWCFNAVTRAEGQPSAVLVRALEPLEGIDLMRARRRLLGRRDVELTNGPGKLCQALGIDGSHNRVALDESPLRILPGDTVAREAVTVTPRIGISRSADWMLRWFVSDSPFVSKTPPSFPRSLPDR
jgi:DNA-3-methyladenine glycosylase